MGKEGNEKYLSKWKRGLGFEESMNPIKERKKQGKK